MSHQFRLSQQAYVEPCHHRSLRREGHRMNENDYEMFLHPASLPDHSLAITLADVTMETLRQ